MSNVGICCLSDSHITIHSIFYSIHFLEINWVLLLYVLISRPLWDQISFLSFTLAERPQNKHVIRLNPSVNMVCLWLNLIVRLGNVFLILFNFFAKSHPLWEGNRFIWGIHVGGFSWIIVKKGTICFLQGPVWICCALSASITNGN